MFDSMRKKVDSTNDIETIIGRSTAINGQISGSGNIRVDGRVDGGIAVAGDAIIGESGIIVGDIKARSLVVAGTVNGNV
ncbi:MAG: polymer-forming cytoskeletal protein, partial [Selenomonadaceae bacterium]